MSEPKPNRERMREMGARGGKSTREKHGRAHFSAAGATGGAVTLSRYGAGWLRGNLAKGRARTKALIELGRQTEAAREEGS